MARAAVKAKQAQQAQAQAAAKPSRKQRKHASGGNPNQDLFFMRLRRKQKWVFLGLAIVFAISFAALGVGSGNGGGLEQMFSGILGGNSDALSKAEAAVKDHPNAPQGYKDLADAYTAKQDLPNAIIAMQAYLRFKKKDSGMWAQLASLEQQQASKYALEYQQIQQATALQAPGSIFTPTGKLAKAFGTNPIDEYYTQQNYALIAPIYRNATSATTEALTAFQQSAKYAKRADLPYLLLQVSYAAQRARQPKVGLAALKRYVALDPNSPNLPQIESLCTQLGGSCKPAAPKKK